jgi:hypothetical protein
MQNMLTMSDGMQGKTTRRVDWKRRLAVLAMVAAVLASGIVWAAEAVGALPEMVTKPSASAWPTWARIETRLAPLDGASTFRLRVPPNPPMKQLAGGQHSTL